MEILKNQTLLSLVADNIGQLPIEKAQSEIDRLNKEKPSENEWKMDFSEFLYSDDETDFEVNNPATLRKGNCWVTCSTKHFCSDKINLYFADDFLCQNHQAICKRYYIDITRRSRRGADIFIYHNILTKDIVKIIDNRKQEFVDMTIEDFNLAFNCVD